MRICRVAIDGRPSWGRVDEDVIHLLHGSPLDGEHTPTGATVPLTGAVFLPPVVPPVFYAVGLNYKRHAAHALSTGYASAVPDRPEVGYRANNALTGHGAPIVKPAGVEGRFEAEGEVVAVIGRPLRRASYAEAQESIFGWTIGNDVSARAWQHRDRSFWRSKNSDTFKPMGPWIETDVDPLAQTTTVRVNSDVRAEFPTGDMIFDPYEYIVETTKYITMNPGDVLWMGADSLCQLEPGDTVDIEISGIGVLSNPVHAE
ncbi:fumarylacetoacetate hydrolase family protein [Planomonospora venezuelensis]|uniref:2-keto-4-pentenoate hydratase/2-oxohepta-3-ene-1,7-dioic acid hydratase in catechol pathway n=1 Tax=Planomonospora venezuelensis TaxID=1999 RepID=A0A841DEN3_PLAVE|nr:fumarylacetoacetate hydrolase family protein [Planomonospora venezuelensis]MBB5967377.1 2-keto-4-pentenoate hydratase/2-oxohepta-3-ene-1,7-dioic acid hydratase in catechol pathway [Planomonospora venezuelensis]GIN03145.1 2-keto-4-pentenoate hydratase [Planomonospora venezuelensis]